MFRDVWPVSDLDVSLVTLMSRIESHRTFQRDETDSISLAQKETCGLGRRGLSSCLEDPQENAFCYGSLLAPARSSSWDRGTAATAADSGDGKPEWDYAPSARPAAGSETLAKANSHRPVSGKNQKAGPPSTKDSAGVWQVNRTNVTLSNTVTDADGDTANLTFQVYTTDASGKPKTQVQLTDPDTGKPAAYGVVVSEYVTSGGKAEVTLRYGDLKTNTTYAFRTSAYDGTLYETDWSSWTKFHTRGRAVSITLPEPNKDAPTLNQDDYQKPQQIPQPSMVAVDPAIPPIGRSAADGWNCGKINTKTDIQINSSVREAMDAFLVSLIWDADPADAPALTGGGGFFPPAADRWRPRVLLVCPPEAVSGKAHAWERVKSHLEELRGPFAAECQGRAGRPDTCEDFTALLHEWGDVITEAARRGWGLVGLPGARGHVGSGKQKDSPNAGSVSPRARVSQWDETKPAEWSRWNGEPVLSGVQPSVRAVRMLSAT